MDAQNPQNPCLHPDPVAKRKEEAVFLYLLIRFGQSETGWLFMFNLLLCVFVH